MTTISLNYAGQLRCELEHLGNHEKLVTDAPLDNKGKGEAFSPTDLVASALISCMVTIIGIAAHKMGLAIKVSGQVNKEMLSAPRRIGKLSGEIMVNCDASQEQKATLEKLARNCPVALSLSEQLEQSIHFTWLD